MSTTTTPSALTYDAIRTYAEMVGNHYEIYSTDGHADIDKLVATLGGSVVYEQSTESLHVVEPGRFTVFLPPFTSSRRDRFTLAHELGHYFLHYVHAGMSAEAAFGRGARNLAETQANVFASSLLMPEASFKAAHADLGGDPWSLARRFDVSPAAASVRAEVLRLS